VILNQALIYKLSVHERNVCPYLHSFRTNVDFSTFLVGSSFLWSWWSIPTASLLLLFEALRRRSNQHDLTCEFLDIFIVSSLAWSRTSVWYLSLGPDVAQNKRFWYHRSLRRKMLCDLAQKDPKTPTKWSINCAVISYIYSKRQL
jgi:hypothetical protein